MSQIIHCSQHKCLTMYYYKVMHRLYNWRPYKKYYEHLESIEGVFYNTYKNYKCVSTNGFQIDIERLQGDWRISRFIRDPRDLIVSGYFYHKRGAEPWFRYSDPTEKYWQPINGRVPEGLQPGQSYSDYLNSVDVETGLIAEIQFRQFHLESMQHWPEHPHILTLKYEDILGNEKAIFKQLFEFYQLSELQTQYGLFWVDKYRAKKQTNNQHLRNPKPNQWREVFTDQANDYFNQRYWHLLTSLGYESPKCETSSS